jgi:hypothetical protein
MRNVKDAQTVYVSRPTDPWEKAGMVSVLLEPFRRPLAAVFLVLMLVLGLLMLLHPSWTALALLVTGGLLAVHHVHRRVRH